MEDKSVSVLSSMNLEEMKRIYDAQVGTFYSNSK